MTNPLRTLQEYGQSVWLDFLSRDLLRGGELKRLIADDGLRGMTSNPSIFEKAIGHGEDYDAQIAELEAKGDLDPGALFERLAVTDIQNAADALRPVYDQTQGRDGYVSIEVSPYLAMQTDATIDEARRLWREIGRNNLMVKIPATRWLTKRSTRRSPRPPIPPKRRGSKACRVRSRSPMPSSPIRCISGSSGTSAGSGWPSRGLRPNGCCGPAPEPKTRPTAMCSMSRS